MHVRERLFAGLITSVLFGCGAYPIGESQHASLSPATVNDEPDPAAFKDTSTTTVSTFSIDVDTASYTIARAYIENGSLPPANAVRVEEFVNYFDYHYVPPQDDAPFAVHTEVGDAPWAASHRLVKIGIKAKEIPSEQRGPSNLVFLIDTSGSMRSNNKLPLLKLAMNMLVDQIAAEDRIAIVTYAGAAGVVLESTSGSERDKIRQAINNLSSGGTTNGEAGISAAYNIASLNYLNGGVNRVILCTDGDFNVGQTDPQALVELIRQKAENGIFLTALGFGMHANDVTLEKLADNGDGNYAYIDNMREAKKTLVAEINGTLVTVAKDVKIQVEFDSSVVKAFRLVGYENRILATEDFVDDTKDAGEVGAGHKVTAFYEIALQDGVTPGQGAQLMTLKVRYKPLDSETSTEIATAVSDDGVTGEDFRFASAVASFAMVLRNSPYKGDATYSSVLDLATASIGPDLNGYRQGFVDLVTVAKSLAGG